MGSISSFFSEFDPHTVVGSWLIVTVVIAAVIVVALILRVAFPIKPQPIGLRSSQVVRELLAEEVGR